MNAQAMVGRELGNYIVRSLLGEGGMGAVFIGQHRFLGTQVAIKVLHGSYASDADVSQRFFQEAKSSLEIGHPNIIRVLDFGQSAIGELYLVMELLTGASLGQSVAQVGVFDERQAARVAYEIACALDASHKKGIVHRDLKPDNVFLTSSGEVKVLDFGIAKIADAGNATKSGALLGTPQYMAPEQARGLKNVGPCSDIYALGGILFYTMTGRPPFLGESLTAIITQTLFDPPPAPSSVVSVSPAMDALVLRCLAKEPSERPADMAALAVELRAIAGDQPRSSLVRPPSIVHTSATSSVVSAVAGQLVNGASRARPGRAGLGIGAAAAVVAFAIGGWFLWHGSTPTTHAAPVPASAAPTTTVPAVAPPPSKPELVHVVVRSEPAGATVLIDGKDRGTTPAVLELKLPQELRLVADGYLPDKEVVTTVDGPPFKLVPEKPVQHHASPTRHRPPSPHEPGGGLE